MGTQTWHVYDGIAEGDNYVLVVVGPVTKGQKREDSEAWESPLLTTVGGDPLLLNHSATFDHEPDNIEQLELVPENYREQYLQLQEEQEAAEAEVEVATPAEYLFGDDEERVALALAMEARVDSLSAVRDRAIITNGGPRRLVEACEAQILALTRVWDRLELTREPWSF